MLWKQWQLLFSWAPKSLRMLTAAMKLKDSCSLEEKLWHTYVCSVAQSCLTLWDPMDCSPQAPLSMEFSRQEYWSGLPFISPKKNLDSVLKSRDIVLLKVAKGPYSQSYGFSSSHVRMEELDHKEGWAPKNWCLLTVVLEKTLEHPLDCKEIKPVNPKYSLEGRIVTQIIFLYIIYLSKQVHNYCLV